LASHAWYDKQFSVFGELVGSWRSGSCPKLPGRGRSGGGAARARPILTARLGRANFAGIAFGSSGISAATEFRETWADFGKCAEMGRFGRLQEHTLFAFSVPFQNTNSHREGPSNDSNDGCAFMVRNCRVAPFSSVFQAQHPTSPELAKDARDRLDGRATSAPRVRTTSADSSQSISLAFEQAIWANMCLFLAKFPMLYAQIPYAFSPSSAQCARSCPVMPTNFPDAQVECQNMSETFRLCPESV